MNVINISSKIEERKGPQIRTSQVLHKEGICSLVVDNKEEFAYIGSSFPGEVKQIEIRKCFNENFNIKKNFGF